VRLVQIDPNYGNAGRRQIYSISRLQSRLALRCCGNQAVKTTTKTALMPVPIIRNRPFRSEAPSLG